MFIVAKEDRILLLQAKLSILDLLRVKFIVKVIMRSICPLNYFLTSKLRGLIEGYRVIKLSSMRAQNSKKLGCTIDLFRFDNF